MRTGGRLLVDALRWHGIDRVFCVPGESYVSALDAFYDTPEIDLVVAKHEGAASNMAEADGKLTGRPGICFVTRGPGATHASVGVHTARHDATPLILCVGQVPRHMRGREAFQEIEYRQLFQPIAKWIEEVDRADEIPAVVLRAFETATSGRPGPVVLSFPEDVLEESSAMPDTRPFFPSFAAPSDRDLSQTALGTPESGTPVADSRGVVLVGRGLRGVPAVRARELAAGASVVSPAGSHRQRRPAVCGSSERRRAPTLAEARYVCGPDRLARLQAERDPNVGLLAPDAASSCHAPGARVSGLPGAQSRLPG